MSCMSSGCLVFYGNLLLSLTGLQGVFGEPCITQSLLADSTVKKILSPHDKLNDPYIHSCSWKVDAATSGGKINLRINVLPEYFPECSCDFCFVQIFNGFNASSTKLGEWCKKDSGVVTSSGPIVFIRSQSPQNTSFKFEVEYSLSSLTEPTTPSTSESDGGLGVKIGAGVGIGIVFVLVLLFYVAFSKRMRKYKRRDVRLEATPITNTAAASASSPAISTITNTTSPKAPKTPPVTNNPPDYWSVVSQPKTENKN